MQSNRLVRDILILFVVVFVLYLAAFHGVEHLRHRSGGWRVEFATRANGQAAVRISQPKLGIRRVELVFPEEQPGATATNLPAVLEFTGPQDTPFPAPFGRVIYQDLTFLPGAVTFDLFGHEIELLPRTLIVNRREQPWRPEMSLTLWATNKVPAVCVPSERKSPVEK